jgi:hypothetical protein
VKPSSLDVMARLASADPARDLLADESERAQLWWQIVAEPPATRVLRRSSTRIRALIPVLPAVLALSVGVLTAGGVISIGAATQPSGVDLHELHGRGLVTGTVRLVAIATPDPAGGPPWDPVGWVTSSQPTPTSAELATPCSSGMNPTCHRGVRVP